MAGHFTRITLGLAGAALATVTIVAGQDAAITLREAREAETISGDLARAATLYERAAREAGADRAVTARALVGLGTLSVKLGRTDATDVLGRVIREFRDQPAEVAAARAAMRTQTVELTPRRWRRDAEFPFSLSADGRSGLVVTDDLPFRLLLRDLASGQERMLVPGVNRDGARWPVMSPDGRQVACSWLARGAVGTGSGTDALHVIGTEPGATPRPLTAAVGVAQFIPVAWSADSSQILVKRAGPGGGWGAAGGALAWVSAADGTVRTIVEFEPWRSVGGDGFQGPTGVRLSPDGTTIAYTAPPSEASPDRYIYAMSANGGPATAVVTMAGRSTHPTWAPGGQHLLFVNDRAGDNDLWAVRMHGSAPAGAPFVVQSGFAGTLVDMTPAGDLFYLTTNSNFPFSEYIATRGPSGTNVVQHFPGMSGTWSRSGDLAFLSRTGESGFVLIVRNTASGEERTFRHRGLTNVSPRWLSHGHALIVYADPDETDAAGGDFYRVDVTTGTFTRLFARDTSTHRRSAVTTLSPDDRTLYAVARTSARGPWTHLVAIDLATGSETPLLTFPDAGLPGRSDPSLAVSPDGETIAIKAWVDDSSTLGRIVTVRTDGTGYRELHGPFAGGAWADVMRWTPDGQSILFTAAGSAPQTWQILRMAASGGTAEPDGLDSARLTGLDPRPGGVSSFDLSPDGTRLAFSARTPTVYDLWTLDNVLAALVGR